jgi:hypothetical protein
VSAPQWKPGDVAMVVNTAGENKVACFTGRWGKEDEEHWSFADGSTLLPHEVEIARPLVVIDPEDREQIDRLVRAFWDANTDDGDADLDYMQAALRSLVTDPKPDEPQGLGAVVKARAGNGSIVECLTRVSSDGLRASWVDEDGGHHKWSELLDVEVIREGWSE